MSERACNYCTSKELRAITEAQGRVYHVVHEPGIIRARVFSLPPDVDFSKLTHRQKREFHLVSFMELPETCKC